MRANIFDVVIIGGGASGLFLASQLPANLSVAIVECNDRVGKKLLATGNGKCNLTNMDMAISHYNNLREMQEHLDRFGPHDTIATFEKMGLLTRVHQGRVYPFSECASNVLDVLRREVERAGTTMFLSHTAKIVEKEFDTFKVTGVTRNEQEQNVNFVLEGRRVVVATGSNATFGRDSLHLLDNLGHTAKPFQPALVSIKTNKDPIKGLSGVRVKAGVKIGYRFEIGEVLFKDFGLSGIAVFNLSNEIARGRAKVGSVIELDFMPDISLGEVEQLLLKRGKTTCGDLLLGVFHSKVVDRILWAARCEKTDSALPRINHIAKIIKKYKIEVQGLGDKSIAQVMSGGFKLNQFDENMMSLNVKDVYVMGEAVDVDGDCGGYNLQWAWTSAKIVCDSIVKSF